MVLTAIQLLELRNNSQKIREENELLLQEQNKLIQSIKEKTQELNKLLSVDTQFRIKTVELQRLNKEVDDQRSLLQKVKADFLKMQQAALEEEHAYKNMHLKVQEEYMTLENIKKYKEQFV